jgi:hypothetical protein
MLCYCPGMLRTIQAHLFPRFPPLTPRALGWLASELRHPEPMPPWFVGAAPYGGFFMPAAVTAPQPAPVSAFNDATAKLADAMAAELTALQKAITADIEDDIKAAVTNLNNLVGELKQSITGASGSPVKGATVVPQSTPGKIATPDPLPLTSPLLPPVPMTTVTPFAPSQPGAIIETPPVT